jgi:site-specific recombinase XerD
MGKRGDDVRADITLRLTISNAKKVQSRVKGVTVFRKYWSDAKQCNDTSRKFIKPWELQEMTAINNTLTSLSSHVKGLADATDNDIITKDWLNDAIDRYLHPEKYKPKEDPKEEPMTLIKAVNKFIDDAPSRIIQSGPHKGRQIGRATRYQYKQMHSHLMGFLKSEGKEDILLSKVDTDFYNRFVTYLYSQGQKMNTVGKHVKNIKAAINALPMKDRVNCEFTERRKCVKLSEKVDNIYLDETELQSLAELNLTAIPYLDRVRDQFLVLAWTGQRFSDLDQLVKDNILEDGLCKRFIIKQTKTSETVEIPILPQVQAILDKYNYKMPRVIDNQVFNRFIKEVARMAGINSKVKISHTEQKKDGTAGEVTRTYEKWEKVASHTGRRSFVTNLFMRGIDVLEIMRISGHRDISVFKDYIKASRSENANSVYKQFTNN